ncbi:MAG: hypothetical protein ACXWWD_00520 [Chitinophagaceae bacterium]
MILCCIISTTSIAGTLLWSENYESFNPNKYWWIQACSLSSVQKHSGSYSLLCEHSPDAENSGLVANVVELPMSVALANPEITIKYWWYTGSNWNTGAGVKFLRLRSTGYEVHMEFYWNTGTEPMDVSAHGYGEEGGTGSTDVGYSSANWVFNQPINRGRWMEITVHYILNTPGQYNGTLDIYFDGVKKYHSTSFCFRKTADYAYNQFFIPSNSVIRDPKMINYIDDIEIWSGSPGITQYILPPPSTSSKSPNPPVKLLIQ